MFKYPYKLILNIWMRIIFRFNIFCEQIIKYAEASEIKKNLKNLMKNIENVEYK